MVRTNLVSRTPTPSLDNCLNELVGEEQQLQSQAATAQPHVTAVPSEVAYAVEGKPLP